MLIALEAALSQGEVETAQLLLKELHSSGVELREHYYWPLLVKKGKENDEEGLLQVLRGMSNEGLTPSRETLQNYVIPYLLKYSDPANVVVKLQIANIPVMVAAKSVLLELLQMHKIQEAANLAQSYNIRGNAFMKDSLIAALAKSKDVVSFTKLLQITSSKSDVVQTDDAISVENGPTSGSSSAVDIDNIVLRAVKCEYMNIIYFSLLKRIVWIRFDLAPTPYRLLEMGNTSCGLVWYTRP